MTSAARLQGSAGGTPARHITPVVRKDGRAISFGISSAGGVDPNVTSRRPSTNGLPFTDEPLPVPSVAAPYPVSDRRGLIASDL